MNVVIKTDDLLSRAAERDPAALASLYDQFAPSLRGILRRILPSSDEAEEVLENLFLKFWKRTGDRRELKATSEAWLFLTARNEAAQRRRAGQRLPRLNIPVPTHPGARWFPESEEIALLASRLDLLNRSLAQLPKAQRHALDLVLYEGLTEEEVAGVLKEPPGRVRDHLRATMTFVRQRLHTLMGTWTANI